MWIYLTTIPFIIKMDKVWPNNTDPIKNYSDRKSKIKFIGT